MITEKLIAEIAEYLTDRLRSGLDAHQYALALAEAADFDNAFDGKLRLEVRGADTATGNPVPFCIQKIGRAHV